MNTRRVDPWCCRAVELAARLLPSGQRQRYALEFIAELYDLPRSRQVSHSMQVLASAWRLRAALAEAGTIPLQEDTMPTTMTRPVLCRLGFHRFRRAATEDGTRYLRCDRCGKDRYDGFNSWGGPMGI